MPRNAACRLLITSDTPWMISSRQVMGMIALNGQSSGRHGVCSDVSLMT
jgi:hypothetical protein